MRALNIICLGCFLVSVDSWHQLAAQEPAPRNQLTLDASILAGGLSYARMTSSDKLVGAGAGLGTELNIRMVRGEKWGKTSVALPAISRVARSDRPRAFRARARRVARRLVLATRRRQVDGERTLRRRAYALRRRRALPSCERHNHALDADRRRRERDQMEGPRSASCSLVTPTAGMVITGVAERMRERIAAIVYLDAFMLSNGQSFSSLRSATDAPYPVPSVPAPPAAVFKVNEKDVAWVNSKLTPHPTKCFTDALHVSDAYQTIPKKVYIRAPAFQTAAFDAAYARCRADSTWKTFEMSGGHDVMLDQPTELVTILEGDATVWSLRSTRGRLPCYHDGIRHGA